ncbi:MAG: hypothetical protein ACYTG6_01845 [Planctomycetota bacterium]|jgi:hypothetical protein
MTGRRLGVAAPVIALVLVLALLGFAACGDGREQVHHGLSPPGLVPAPQGDAFRVGAKFGPGDWTAEIRIDLTDRTGDDTQLVGGATVRMRQVVTPAGEGAMHGAYRSHLDIEVVDSSGIGGRFIRGWHELGLAVGLDEQGRPVEGTLRFDRETRRGMGDLLARLWLGGFGGGRPWIPVEGAAVGQVWGLAATDLAENLGGLEAQTGVELPPATYEGGARLEAVEETEAGRYLDVRLDALTQVEGEVPGGSLSVGHRARGRALLSIETGLPARWEIAEHLRMRASGSVAEPPREVTLRWVGEVHPTDE